MNFLVTNSFLKNGFGQYEGYCLFNMITIILLLFKYSNSLFFLKQLWTACCHVIYFKCLTEFYYGYIFAFKKFHLQIHTSFAIQCWTFPAKKLLMILFNHLICVKEALDFLMEVDPNGKCRHTHAKTVDVATLPPHIWDQGEGSDSEWADNF